MINTEIIVKNIKQGDKVQTHEGVLAILDHVFRKNLKRHGFWAEIWGMRGR